MRAVRFIGGCWLACLLAACGSSDDTTTGGAGASGGASNNGQAGSSGSAGSSAGSPTANAGSTSSGSPACQTYCECHEKNCASTDIPGGMSCSAFCAAMTADQLACRQNMCGLVPPQPDNNHCAHSVGTDECL